MRYFLSGEYEDEIGHLKMPAYSYGRIQTARGISEIPYDQYRPNTLRRASVRANVQAATGPKVDVGVSTGFIMSSLRLPQTGQ